MIGIEEIVFLDPLTPIGRRLMAYCKPYSCVCDGRAGFESDKVDFRPSFNDRALGVVILEPEET